MVMALVVKRIGFDRESGRAWLGVNCQTLHPKYKRAALPSHSDESNKRKRRIYEVDEDQVRYDFERATSNDGYDRNNVVDGLLVYDMMIRPIITSFVHGTCTNWLEELRQFLEGAEAWMDSVRGLGFDFFGPVAWRPTFGSRPRMSGWCRMKRERIQRRGGSRTTRRGPNISAISWNVWRK